MIAVPVGKRRRCASSAARARSPLASIPSGGGEGEQVLAGRRSRGSRRRRPDRRPRGCDPSARSPAPRPTARARSPSLQVTGRRGQRAACNGLAIAVRPARGGRRAWAGAARENIVRCAGLFRRDHGLCPRQAHDEALASLQRDASVDDGTAHDDVAVSKPQLEPLARRVPRDGEDGPLDRDQEWPRLDQPAVRAVVRDLRARRCRPRSARCAPSLATERSRPRVPAVSSNVLPSLKSTLTPATPDCERYPPSSSVPPSIRETLTGGSGGSPRSCPTETNLTAATRQTVDDGADQRQATKAPSPHVAADEACADRIESLHRAPRCECGLAASRPSSVSATSAGALLRICRVSTERHRRRPQCSPRARSANSGSASTHRERRADACAIDRFTVETEISIVVAISSTVIASIRRRTNTRRSRGLRRSSKRYSFASKSRDSKSDARKGTSGGSRS